MFLYFMQSMLNFLERSLHVYTKKIYILDEKKSLHILRGHVYNLLLICITPFLQLFIMDKLHYQNPVRENFSGDLWAEMPWNSISWETLEQIIIFSYLNDIKITENTPFCSVYGTLHRNSQKSSFEVVLRYLLKIGTQVAYQPWPTRTKIQIFGE